VSGSDQILGASVEDVFGGIADTFVVCAGAGLPVGRKTVAEVKTLLGQGTMAAKSTYQLKVALSGYDQLLTTGTKKGFFDIDIPGVITGFKVCCDPANEPSAAAAQFDLNTVDASTGALTSVLSSVASIATGANVSTGGAISGSPTVAAGDKIAVDCDQGSDGKFYVATLTVTAT